MSEIFYFVGEYADVGHDEKEAGIERGGAYPVFSTYNKSDQNQKHTNAWFVYESDAVEWAKFKNGMCNPTTKEIVKKVDEFTSFRFDGLLT